jgi:sarcosine oxidase subunit alpha
VRRGDLEFVFEGRTLTAREGDSVAAALFANGVRVFGRSSKYHRPRGYRCGRGHCSACAMRVDGLPGVRTCVTPVRDGMRVEREHAWPGAGHDLLRAAEMLAPLTPPGFYYRWFRRSPKAFGVFERAIASAAGQGALPSLEAAQRLATARCRRRDDIAVLVVGGGAAGLSAALAAAGEGADVLLVEQDDRLGGRLADAPGDQAMGTLVGRVRDHAGIETLTSAEAIAWYEEGVLAVDCRPDLLLVRPTAVVLATGGYERGLPFPGWDLPGVMLAQGAQRLLRRFRVSPGSRAVVLTTDDSGYAAALELNDGGVEIACVADVRPPQAIRQRHARDAEAAGIALLTGVEGARAHGTGPVSALSLRLGGDGPPKIVRHKCDLVCISAGTRPADDLAYQSVARGSLVLSADSSLEAVAATGALATAGTPVLGPWLAGLVVGADTAAAAIVQGRVAGAAAARAAAAPAT